MNGSILAVLATGTSSMSDSLIACQPADAAAVKAKPMIEAIERQLADRAGRMLPQTREIHEPQIEEFELFFLCRA